MRHFIFLIGVLALLSPQKGTSQIKLPELISDGMVLQRGTPLILWGQASPGEEVELGFKGKHYRTTTDAQGQWTLELEPQRAGGPYEMVFKGTNKITVRDLLFGDVWIGAGQSNMVLPMERVKEKYPTEVAQADYPQIRNFFIPTATDLQGPQRDLPPSQWKAAVGRDVLSMGAVTYFFAKELYNKYGIPIGIINASTGGTPIQAWIGEEGFKGFPQQMGTIDRNKDASYIQPFTTKPKAVERPIRDKGLTGPVPWYQLKEVQDWHNFYIPGYWEDQGNRNLDGVVWFRREIEVPPAMLGNEAKLYLGRIVDADQVYVNGSLVGNITYQYPPRRYTLPKGTLREGMNSIVVRVSNYSGKGGFVPDKDYELIANGIQIDLKGEWKYKVGEIFDTPTDPGTYDPFWAQNQPASLYNAMIAPLTRAKIKGFLWYQGESDTQRPNAYRELLPALIKNWRERFKGPDLPFLYVQLANFQDVDHSPTESRWAELRDAQSKALSLPNTAMAVALDLGEWNDIHPLNKEDVGKRLALGAQKLAYGEDLVHSGPILKTSHATNGTMILHFDHLGSGLVAKGGGPLNRFEIAGENMEFVWAEAEIQGSTVRVRSDEVPHPKYVRYAWADNPRGANLYNREGLPASPFQNFDPQSLDSLPWRGKRATVVLTYDDALNVHLDNAVPLLDSLGIKGTFYVSTYSPAFRDRLKDWRKISENGHELANHSIYHPCRGGADRPWVSPDYDMATYSVQRMVDEIRINNTLLEALDGKKERTYAFPCDDVTVRGGATFMEGLKGEFVAVRAAHPIPSKIDQVNLFNMGSIPIVEESGSQMIARVKEAIANRSLLIFLFHGVGGEHPMDVSLEAHRELLGFLHQERDEVWTATLLEVAEHIREFRSRQKGD